MSLGVEREIGQEEQKIREKTHLGLDSSDVYRSTSGRTTAKGFSDLLI